MGWTKKIMSRGYTQWGIYYLLNALVTNFNLVLTKLDADGTVNGTNYSSLWAISTPTIGATYGKGIKPSGMNMGDMAKLCYYLRTNLNGVLTKLAADTGVNGTTVYTSLKFSSTANLVDESNAKIKQLGVNQGSLADFLDALLNSFNYMLIVLDADTGVSDTDYDSTYHISDNVEASSSSSSCRSSSSSSRSSSSCSSSSSSCSSSSSSCKSSSSSRSSSSSSSSCRSSSSSSSSRSSSSSSRSSSSSSCRSSSSSSSSNSSSSSSQAII